MINKVSVLIFFVFCCCNGQGTKFVDEQVKIPQQDNFVHDWKKDSEGCLKLRTKELAEKLIETYSLRKGGKDAFLQIFGEPNEINQSGDNLVLTYFFDTVCKDGKIEIKGDKCYANFYFFEGELDKEDYLCE